MIKMYDVNNYDLKDTDVASLILKYDNYSRAMQIQYEFRRLLHHMNIQTHQNVIQNKKK